MKKNLLKTPQQNQFLPFIVLCIFVDFLRYDSLTGVPKTQKTMGFEKGSVLFNIGALYTQIGCKQVRQH